MISAGLRIVIMHDVWHRVLLLGTTCYISVPSLSRNICNLVRSYRSSLIHDFTCDTTNGDKSYRGMICRQTLRAANADYWQTGDVLGWWHRTSQYHVR